MSYIISSSGDDPDVPVDWHHIDVEAIRARHERLRYRDAQQRAYRAYMDGLRGEALYREIPRDDPPREALTAPSVVSPRFGELITALNSGTLDHTTADRYITMLGDFDLDGDGQKVKDHARA